LPKRNVLVLTSAYPTVARPIKAVFVKEHARTIALLNRVLVLYVQRVPLRRILRIRSNRVWCVRDQVEDGIRTVRFEYVAPLVGRIPLLGDILGLLLDTCAAFYVLARMRSEFTPDLIHAHFYKAGVVAALLGKWLAVPVVVSEHYSGFSREVIRGVQQRIARFSLENATVVCPVSDALKEAIAGHGIRATFRVVPNSVDPKVFSVGVDSGRMGGRRGKKRVLFVGSMEGKKGLPYLVEALALVAAKRTDFEAEMIGEGPEIARYKASVQRLGLRDAVRFSGVATRAEVAAAMRKCDFLVLPSEFETFGIVLIEAMACGKPVIATDVGGPKSIVSRDVGELVPPRDVSALARAIDRMLDCYSEYSPERIALRAMARFGYSRVAQKWQEIYGEAGSLHRGDP